MIKTKLAERVKDTTDVGDIGGQRNKQEAKFADRERLTSAGRGKIEIKVEQQSEV